MHEVRLRAHRLADHVDAREALEDLFPQHLELQLREAVAHAAVDAEAEAHVLARPRAIDDEAAGVLDRLLVAVARDVPHDDLVALADLLAAELDVGGRGGVESQLVLLVIACPCALVISTPVAIYAAIGNASARGALIKGGKFLEAMSQIKAIALDKTRTITFGNPIVSDIIPLNGTSREELLACAAGAEVFSEHPLAQAIVDASKNEGFDPHKAEGFRGILGKGAIAKCLVCTDETIYIGKLSFIREHQPVADGVEEIVERLSGEGKTSVVISFGNGVAGILGLMDEIKPDSSHALQQMMELNIAPVMLTGDGEKAAIYVAAKVGIKRVFGGLLPKDKAGRISELLKEYGIVAMVGDGINDAPALARASVGIAMGAAGSDTAIETANIALMNDKLSLLPFLVRLSKATLRRIRINTIGAVLVKLFFVILVLLGYDSLVFAIAADVGVTIAVILFSLNLIGYE